MPQVRALAARLAFITLLGGAACGDGGAPPGAPDDIDDTPGQDAGSQEDAGDDAETVDPGTDDGGTSDAMTTPDAGEDISECEGDLLEFEGARSAGRPLSASIIANTVHLVYVVPSGGGSSGNNTAQGLRYVPFDTTGAAGAGVDVVNVGIGMYNWTRDPALVAAGNKVELFYNSNSAGQNDLFYIDLSASSTPVRETSSNTLNEFAVAGSTFGDGPAVVYSNEPAALNMPGALTFKQPGKAAVELVSASVGYHASQVAFTEVGSTGERRGVAAFISDLAAKSGILAIPMASGGGPNGALVTLSSQIGGASAVDVARGKDGRAGLIYTEAPAGGVHQLRFRQVADDGTISNTVRNLTSGNLDLRDISISAYSHGYVIAYRRIGGLPGAAATINLLFVDTDGNRGGTRLVRAASQTGGGLKVLVANDGRLVVLWGDTQSVTNPTTNKSELALKVRAARLNCAQ